MAGITGAFVMSIEPTFDDELARRLPLPLAQLYRRAFNAKNALDRHNAAYCLWEAAQKLLGSVAIVTYAERSDPHPDLFDRLRNLARPALGHWWEFIRLLVPLLADAGDEAFGTVRNLLLDRAREDLPRAAGLDAALRDVLEGTSGARVTVRLSELFERLVRYRNLEIGHGAPGQRPAVFYDRMGRTLLLGMAEILGRLDVLAGRRLIFIADVRRLSSGNWLVERYELAGESACRLESMECPAAENHNLPHPGRLYLESPGKSDGGGRGASCSLHPLTIYEPDSAETFFLNARRGEARTEYLCYHPGRTVQRRDLGGEHRNLLARVLGAPVGDGQLVQWASLSQSEEPPISAPAGSPRRRLGEFELLSELGRGGMGVVYRAWQPSLGRQVALKSLLHAGDPKAEARFNREIHALGRVEHPHLVKVFTSGTEYEQWFYAMELVEGATLAAVCGQLGRRSSTASDLDLDTWRESLCTACQETREAERPLLRQGAEGQSTIRPAGDRPGALVSSPPGSRDYIRHVVALVRQVAEAAHALHEAGVVHRDIKPENILVTPDGRQAVLMDLGLAQLADETEGRLTRTRQFVGTLRYASPEQVLSVPLDRRSDVYSLGATLWELLTLRPLFGAGEQMPTPELMLKVQSADPDPPRRHNLRVPADLDAIVMKCLEKDRCHRYATGADLAEELRRFQAGEPVQARRIGSTERGWRWCRRNPMLASASVLTATAVLLAMLSTGYFLYETKLREARDEATSRARVLGFVQAIRSADIEQLPNLLRAIGPDVDSVVSLLRGALSDPNTDSPARLRFALASMKNDDPYLEIVFPWLLEAPPSHLLAVSDILAPHRSTLSPRLWRVLDDPKASPVKRINAACVLTLYQADSEVKSPDEARWNQNAGFVAAGIISAILQNPRDYAPIAKIFRPVRHKLFGPLAEVFRQRDSSGTARRNVATNLLLIDGYADRAEDLVVLVQDAENPEFSQILEKLSSYGDAALNLLVGSFHTSHSISWNDPPQGRNDATLSSSILQRFESGGGLATGRFAICQKMALDVFRSTTEEIRHLGYRPVRARPFSDGDTISVASIWIRDGVEFHVAIERDIDSLNTKDAQLRVQGYHPIEAAGFLANDPGEQPQESYLVIWSKASGTPRSEMLLGVRADQISERTKAFVKAGLVPLTRHTLASSGRGLVFSEIWVSGKGQTDFPRAFVGTEDVYLSEIASGGLQVDLSLSRDLAAQKDEKQPGTYSERPSTRRSSYHPVYAAIWRACDDVESIEIHGLSLEEARDRWQKLISDGYRPAAISSIEMSGQIKTAAVWHRPKPSRATRELFAARMGRLITALVQLGQAERCLRLLNSVHDPTVRTEILLGLCERSTDSPWVGSFTHELREDSNAELRQFLILLFGQLAPLSEDARNMLRHRLMTWYRSDPDPGVHSAIEWTLRRKPWQMDAELKSADNALRTLPIGGRGWYVNSLMQTMAIIPAGSDFMMGSPPDELGRQDDESLHRVRIDRSYAIATKEVTVGQYKLFRIDYPEPDAPDITRYSPENDCPMVGPDWFQAIAFCRWLSEREGVSEDQQCYPPVKKILADAERGVVALPSDYLRRTGYRLPTESEWEHACRAGSQSSCPFGENASRLRSYSWYQDTSGNRTHPVGLLMPNGHGLFDMLGNVFEWCQDPVVPYRLEPGSRAAVDIEFPMKSYGENVRILRGGAITSRALDLRSANRMLLPGSTRGNTVGFRVARTHH